DELATTACSGIRSRDRPCRMLRGGHVASAKNLADVRGEQPLVYLRLLRDRHSALPQLTPGAADQRRERAPLPAQPALEPSTQARGKERALALRRDRDQQRVAPHDRGSGATTL